MAQKETDLAAISMMMFGDRPARMDCAVVRKSFHSSSQTYRSIIARRIEVALLHRISISRRMKPYNDIIPVISLISSDKES